jgi:uncharacterized OB-fold protein
MVSPKPYPDLTDDSPEVVDTPGGAQLLGSVCRACRAAAFPARAVCYRCGGTRVDRAPIGSRGHVYASTTVHVSSVRPTPYHLAYVDLEDGPRVLGRVDAPVGIGDLVRVTGGSHSWTFTR